MTTLIYNQYDPDYPESEEDRRGGTFLLDSRDYTLAPLSSTYDWLFANGDLLAGRWFNNPNPILNPGEPIYWLSVCFYLYFKVDLELSLDLVLADARLRLALFNTLYEEYQDIKLEIGCVPAGYTEPNQYSTDLVAWAEVASVTSWIPFNAELVDLEAHKDLENPPVVLSENIAETIETALRSGTWASGKYIKLFVRGKFFDQDDTTADDYCFSASQLADGTYTNNNLSGLVGAPDANNSYVTAGFAGTSNSLLLDFSLFSTIPDNKVIEGMEITVTSLRYAPTSGVVNVTGYLYDTVAAANVSGQLFNEVVPLSHSTPIVVGGNKNPLGLVNTDIFTSNVRLRIIFVFTSACTVNTDAVRVKVFYSDNVETPSDSMILDDWITRLNSFVSWIHAYNYFGEDIDDVLASQLPPQLLLRLPSDMESSVFHELEVFQEIGHAWKLASVTSDVTVDQDVAATVIFNRSIVQDIVTEQTVRGVFASDYEPTIEDNIIVNQDITGGRSREKTIEHTVTVDQNILVDGAFYKTIQHEIDVEQDITGGRVKEKSVQSVLYVFQTITTIGQRYFNVEHVLDLEQTIETTGSTLAFAQNIVHDVTVDQTISYTWTKIISVESVVDVTHAFTFVPTLTTLGGTSVNPTLQWFPSIKGGDDSVTGGTFPSEPTLTVATQFKLEFPPTSPTKTVILPPPILTNREELEPKRIQRFTRGGDIKTKRDAAWPIIYTLRYKFEDLTDAQRSDMFDFIGTSLGREIKITDHEGREWTGIVINPNGEFINIFRDCGSTTEFDFRGTYV